MTKSKMGKKWSTDAEMSLMGFTIKVESDEHLKHMVKHVLNVIRAEESSDEYVEDIISSAYKFNSNNTKVSHFAVSGTDFGTLLTFVRDEEMTSLTSRDGVLAYVYNLDCTWCSELGYVFFGNENGRVVRLA